LAATVPERVLTVVVRDASDPERVVIVLLMPAIVVERADCARESVK
jgi:hypothetical protein